jgi:sugar phosphate isomerase/epimerase
MLGDRNLVSGNEANRAMSVQYTKDCIDLVAGLNGTEMTIVPGDGRQGDAGRDGRAGVGLGRLGLKDIYAHAQPLGVRLAIEPLNRFETYFINRGRAGDGAGRGRRRRVRRVPGRVPHQHRGEGPLPGHRRLRSAAGRLPRRGQQPHAGRHGRLRLEEVVDTLRSVGYDGALTAEFVAPIDRTPVNKFPNALETKPVDISAEQMKFIEDHGSSTLSEEFYDWLTEQNASTCCR